MKHGKGRNNILNMKFVYVSHPYTGDEKENVKSARKYCRWIKANNPDWIIFNPLDNNKFMHKCDYEHDDYMDIDLAIIKELCDIVVMCGNWKSSIGCTKELAMARAMGKEIYFCDRMNYYERKEILNNSYSMVQSMVGGLCESCNN